MTWTVTVTNKGPDSAVDAYVDDVIPSELTGAAVVSVSKGSFVGSKWTIGNLTNGEKATLVIKTTVSASNVNITNVALVNSTTYDPNETNNKDNDTVEIPPEADLSVVKEASVEKAHIGDTVTWTVTVTNKGPDSAVDAYVDDVIPSELTGAAVVSVSKGSFVGSKWTIGNLTNGEKATLVIKTTVSASNVNITNVALVNSTTYDPNETNNKDNDTVEIPPEADLSVVKEASVEKAHIGDTVTWTVTVTNKGPDSAVDAYVDDVIPSELTGAAVVSVSKGSFVGSKWTIGNLTNGEKATLVIKTTVSASNVNITNVALVNSTTYDPNETNNKDNDTVEIPPEADLSVVKEASVEKAHIGDTVIWTVTVTNNGPDTAVDAYVDDVFPSGLTEIRIITATKGSFRGDRWTIGNLTNGETVTIVFASIVSASNVNITNVVLVNSSTYDPNLTNNKDNDTVKVSPEADLAVEKTVDVKEAHIGDVVTWTIKVTNKGPDSAVDAYVEDVIPTELTNATVVSVSKGNFTGSKWTIGNLTNGETVTLVVKTTVAKSNVNITNVALVNSSTYDPNETNNKDNDTVEIPPEADLEIIKKVSSDAVHYGDTVTWTVTLVNKGPDSAVNVSVKDVLPKELIYSGEYTSTRGEYKDNVWFIDEVANGETLTLVIKTTVNATSTTIVNVVNVTSDTYDPNETNNNDSNKTYVSPEADLEIVKLVSNASAHKGDIINWTIIVTNLGFDVAENVVVNETVPDGLIVLNVIGGEIKDGVWTIGDLARGKNATLIIETQINTTNKTIVNIVNVTSDTYDPVLDNNNATNQTAIPPEADLSITKTVSNASAHKGDVVTWTIVLVNNGPDAAINVSVTDVIPDTLIYGADDVSVDKGSFKDNVWFIGEVAKGETLTLTVKTTVDATNTTIVNVVNVTSDTYDPNKTNNNATNNTVIPPEADLEVIITNNYEQSGDVCHKGDEIVWTITVTNHGPDDAINSILKDVLPDGIIYVSHDTANGTYDNESAVWTIGDLPVGETVTLTIVSKANTTNKTINRDVSVSSDTYDPNLSNNKDDSSVDIPPEADLQVTITNNYEENGTSAHNGDEVVWTITVTNNGPDDAINTVLKDILPDGLIYVSDDSDGAYDNESAVWTIGDLPVGETVTLTIKTLVNASNTTITKEVSVSSDTYDPDLSNNKDNSSVDVIPEADLEIIKVVSNQSPHKNDKITWTIIVKNNGGDTAVNTVVTDKLPSGVVYVSDDSNGAYDSKSGIWKVGDLAKGESATLNIVVLVKTTNKTIVNAANATSDTYDPNEDNNKCNSSITVPPEADLVLTIEPSATKVTVGDKVDFTITVVNQGPDTAVNTRAYVKLPAGLKLVNFKPSKGTYDPKTGIWTIGDLAPGEKVTLILNTKALVSGKFVIDAYTVCDTYESDLTNNNDTTEIEVVEPEVSGDKSPAKGVPANTMHATGNPILMVLLALLSIAGFSLRRKS